MKLICRNLSLVVLLFSVALSLGAQNVPGSDSTGLPGDHFSLQGALQLFQKLMTMEEFEKALNSEANNINNLDLNGDGEIDYVRVIDRQEGDVHVFILQVPVSSTESQDIAVIELERTGTGSAIIQITGDEDIYGEEVIIEPDGGQGSQSFQNSNLIEAASGPYDEKYEGHNEVVVNVWFWPTVRYIYGPIYQPWVSPWKWRHYPGWWKPWRPAPWYVFHPRRVHYHRQFVVAHTHCVVRARTIYAPVRVSSVSVQKRHYASVSHYRVNRTKTTYTGPKGNSVTRTTTTVRSKNGHVKASKTTAKRRKG